MTRDVFAKILDEGLVLFRREFPLAQILEQNLRRNHGRYAVEVYTALVGNKTEAYSEGKDEQDDVLVEREGEEPWTVLFEDPIQVHSDYDCVHQ